ncbi:MAG: hypothetical protein CSA81_01080 [Acidobacteria bacterium]|nr:MAG: hypothetical protein CSA81_01080 [Acidobacteriota bacterium]
MVYYEKDIKKEIAKGNLPKNIARLFHDAFQALDSSRNLNLFDIKKLISNSSKEYYRLRKGKYRAIFTIEGNDFFVHAISKRSEVYRQWP